MNCNETRPLLHAYHDAELDLANNLKVEQHLKDCPACTAGSQSLQSLHQALQRVNLNHRAPKSLRARINREIAAPEVPGSSRDGVNPIWQWLALGATAFAVVTLLLRPAGISGHDQLVNEAIAGHVRSLMAGHLTDVVSSDQHTVKPWFNGRLDFAPPVKDFAEQGFPLVGGRLDYLGEQPVAALVYRHNKHFINVFIWPAKTDQSASQKTDVRRGYAVIECGSNGLQYCVVSDLNEQELSGFARMIVE